MMGLGGDLFSFNRCLESGGTSLACDEEALTLELAFDGPVDFVEIRSATVYGLAGFLAFDATGAIIGGCSDPENLYFFGSLDSCGYTRADLDSGDGIMQTVWLNRSEADISRVWFGWTNQVAGAAIAVNRISYGSVGGGSVAEPSATALFCLGLAGVALRLRRIAN
jgi:hypothetical protein